MLGTLLPHLFEGSDSNASPSPWCPAQSLARREYQFVGVSRSQMYICNQRSALGLAEWQVTQSVVHSELGRKTRAVGEPSWAGWQLNRALKEGEIRIGGDEAFGLPEGVAGRVSAVCNLEERLQRLCVSTSQERRVQLCVDG